MNNKPKFYRQRFLLALLHFINAEITRTDLHKHSFLFSQQTPMGYDFVPYQYGCYSFQLDKDLLDLSEQGFIQIIGKKIKLKIDNPITWLKTKDSKRLCKYPEKQKQLKGDDLIAFVYKKYPYYAINSEIIDRVCSAQEKTKIENKKQQIKKKNSAIYTLGYEGISLEAYINKLIQNNIKLLCDVRKNPLSRKFGFSYKALNNILPKFGIHYEHIPELGIASDKRQDLGDVNSYKKLFDEYRTILPRRKEALQEVLDLQEKHQRIALTCFEKSHHNCHRYCISDYFVDNYAIKTVHL